jgi:hypothetical protein
MLPRVPQADDVPQPADFEEIEAADDGIVWRFDAEFLRSNWTCIWGRGCLGIEADADEAGGRGCCSVGAVFDGDDESRLISALAAMLEPARFEQHAAAGEAGLFADEARTATRVVDGACIFLNRPGFAGGAGCALHLAAVEAGESPRDWKPSVCWQLPIKIDWADAEGGGEVATVRRWTRADWNEEGETMAWCCTEGDRAYVGEATVVSSLAGELEEIVGRAVYVELRGRINGGRTR